MSAATVPQHGVPLSPRAGRVADLLVGWPRRRVTLVELWQLLDTADPAAGAVAGRRKVLAGVVAELGRAGLVRAAGARSWDRSQKPPLPNFVTIPAPATSGAPKRVVWHHKLSWVADVRVTPAQREHLRLVNAWLYEHDHEQLPVVPHRERSVKIFGNEKVLDKLMVTSLFGEGRLTLELVRARRVAPRFTFETVGPGDLLLVVENSDTFDSLVSALTRNPGQVGLVGWGAGGGFEQSVLSVPRLGRAVREVRYFGDLDVKGLQIPANADLVAAGENLPRVRPAAGLYEAMFRHARAQACQTPASATTAAALAGWLPEPLRRPAGAHLMGGTRLAQEEVGITELGAGESWRADLR